MSERTSILTERYFRRPVINDDDNNVVLLQVDFITRPFRDLNQKRLRVREGWFGGTMVDCMWCFSLPATHQVFFVRFFSCR